MSAQTVSAAHLQSSHSTTATSAGPIAAIGRSVIGLILGCGELTLFFLQSITALCTGLPKWRLVMNSCQTVGVESMVVVMLTGAFIGMVLAVQSYDQLRWLGLESSLGSVINLSIVKELGPVLAATMLAGRVGCSMAAELGTMKITEQLDALRALGADPMRYLVVPRMLACLLMTPLLTFLADAAGIFSGWFFSVILLKIDNSHYWYQTIGTVGARDILAGAAKCVCFGVAMSMVSCQRGFNCDAGAEGVGKAATEAFVLSFLTILSCDIVLSILINSLQRLF